MEYAEFEAAVATVLRLSGYDVRGETLIGNKKVDLYAEQRRWGRIRRTAVECKFYARPLTQEQVNEIYSNYRPLYDNGLIDDILLVTSSGIVAGAEALVTLARGLSHVTYNQLQNTIIDFSAYLAALSRQIHDDGLASYYIRPKISGDNDLEEKLVEWESESTRPLAILGSYGMGKTSFVRHLAARLADQAVVNDGARIPVVIKLAEISAEQSLEGLLGRIFTTTGQVWNYTFDAFMELNRRGRFIVFLDGFDEMKHTLVWDQFRYNFKEINRLVMPNSRVVLLGRPTAFLSDTEQQYILHGLRRGGADGPIRDPNWPDYEEIHLQPFSRDQVQYFLQSYTQYLITSGKVPLANAADTLLKIDKLPPAKLADLATRPVQLRILSEVLPQWTGDLTALTAAALYSAFINIVIEREQEKITRRRFDLKERRNFARDLAYWLWTTRSAMSIDATQIPAELFPLPKGDDTPDGVRRDLVSACFLDRKYGDSLYFPHRSFQEFLVAEKAILEIRRVNVDLVTLSASVTPEVGEFITALAEPDDFEHFNRELRRRGGRVRLALMQAWMRNADCAEHVMKLFKRGDSNPWTILQVGVAACLGTPVVSADEALTLFARFAKRLHANERLTLLLAGIMVAESTPDRSVSDSLVNLLRHIFEAAYSEFSSRHGFPVAVRPSRFAQSKFAEPNVARLVSLDGEYPLMRVDFRRAALLVINELGDYPMILDWVEYVRAPQASADGRFTFSVELSSPVLQETDVRGSGNMLGVLVNRLIRIAQ